MTGVEVELKLEFDPGHAEALLQAPLMRGGAGETRHLVATYFDTPERAVRASGHALRVRREGRRRVQTVKADGGAAAGLFARGEWEQVIHHDTPVLDAASGPLLEAIGQQGAARLGPIFSTDVERRTWRLTFEGADIELSVDRGAVRAGDRAAPIAELELELRHGPRRALFDAARMLDGHAPLRLSVRSKSDLGHALIEGALSRPARAQPVALDRGMRAADALRAIVPACIRQYRLNEALLLQSDGVEAVHQARVGLRRLRSALSLFRPLLRGDADARLLDARLRALAGALGDARNLDVLIARIGDDPPPAVTRARDLAHEHVRAELESARPRLILLDLVEWLDDGPWSRAPAHPARLDEPIADFAARRLGRHARRLKRLGHGVAEWDARRAHRARIEAKKARYGAEFLAGLWPSPDARARRDTWLGELERAQDKLGELNDIAIGRGILDELGVEPGRETAEAPAARTLREAAASALETLAKAPAFWTD